MKYVTELVFTGLLLLALSISESSMATPDPRVDLYKKITQQSGVSLREAFLAVQGKNTLAAIHLRRYAKRVGSVQMLKALTVEIRQRQHDCAKAKSLLCEQSVQDLNSQMQFLQDLAKSDVESDKYKQVYYSMVLYGFSIRTRILGAELAEWENSCGTQEQINTVSCQETLFALHSLVDLARDITQLALLKSEKSSVNKSQLQSIQAGIRRYEKL